MIRPLVIEPEAAADLEEAVHCDLASAKAPASLALASVIPNHHLP